MSVTSIAVVDDHPLFREGVIRSLSETGRFRILAAGATGEEAVRIAAESGPDVLLLDLSMPDGGLEALRRIKAANPGQRVVVLTVSETDQDVAQALALGADGYILKGVGSRTLAEAIGAVAAGQKYVAPTLSAGLVSRLVRARQEEDLLEQLSARQREVLEFVAQGLTNKEIALKLDLHEKTVKHHMSRVLAKLQVNNRTAAALAYREMRA